MLGIRSSYGELWEALGTPPASSCPTCLLGIFVRVLILLCRGASAHTLSLGSSGRGSGLRRDRLADLLVIPGEVGRFTRKEGEEPSYAERKGKGEGECNTENVCQQDVHVNLAYLHTNAHACVHAHAPPNSHALDPPT